MTTPLPFFFFFFFCLIIIGFVSSVSGSLSSDYPYLQEQSFESIKNSAAERLVVFYYSSESSSDKILSVVNKVAKKLKKAQPQFQFVACDGDRSENNQHFIEAKFNNGQFIFTSVPVEGILKYNGDVSVSILTRYIESKYYKRNKEDLLLFNNEEEFFNRMDGINDNNNNNNNNNDSTNGIIRPQIVWFTETYCDLCKRLKPAIEIAATYFKEKNIDVVEIICSSNEETTEFCTRHQINNKFPTTLLFDGEEKHQLPDSSAINVIQLEDFINEKIKPIKKNNKKGGKKTKKSKTVIKEEEEIIEEEDDAEKEEKKEKELKKSKKDNKEKEKDKEKENNDKDVKENDNKKSKKGKFSKPSTLSEEKKEEKKRKCYH